MNHTRLVARNTAALVAGEMTLKLIAFFFNVALARLLGVGRYGEYNLINAFIALFTFLPDLGTNSIVVREIARSRRRQRQLAGQAVVTNLMFSALTFVLIVLLFGPYAQGKVSFAAAMIAAATLAVTAFRTVGILQFEARERMGITSLFMVMSSVLSVGGALAGFSVLHTLIGLFAGVFAGTIISTILVWLVTVLQYGRPKLRGTKQNITKLLRVGWPLGLAGFATQAQSRLDTVVLGGLLSSQIVGWYTGASVLVIAGTQLITMPVVTAVFPTLSRLKGKAFRRLLLMCVLAFLIFGIVVIGVTQGFASLIVRTVYGSSFAPAAGVLRRLIILVPLTALSSLFAKVLVILKKERAVLRLSLIGVAIGLVANLLFIPLWGMLGAATAAIATQGVVLASYLLVIRKDLV